MMRCRRQIGDDATRGSRHLSPSRHRVAASRALGSRALSITTTWPHQPLAARRCGIPQPRASRLPRTARTVVTDGFADDAGRRARRAVRTQASLAVWAGVLTVVLWGGTPAATAFAVRGLAPELVGVARLVLAAIIIVPIALWQRWPTPKDSRTWLLLLTSAGVGFAASFVLQSVGIARTSTAHAALIFAAAPVLTGLIAFALGRSWPRPLWWLGGLAALAGEGVLIFSRARAADDPSTLAGDMIVTASVVCLSVGYVTGARLSARIGLNAATGWSIVLGCVLVAPLWPALWSGAASGLPAAAVGGLAYLVLASTIVGYAAWFWALDKGGAGRIAPIQFGQPVVSLILAVLVLSEPIGPSVLIALSLILGGVALCRASSRPRA